MTSVAFGTNHPVHPLLSKVFSPDRRNAARNIVHSGWLELEVTPKEFKKRFVALRDDNKLYIYEKDISKALSCKPEGNISMAQVHRVYSETIKRRKHLLVIESNKDVTYTFRAKNEGTMKEWVEVLHKCQRRAAPTPKAYSSAGHVRARSSGGGDAPFSGAPLEPIVPVFDPDAIENGEKSQSTSPKNASHISNADLPLKPRDRSPIPRIKFQRVRSRSLSKTDFQKLHTADRKKRDPSPASFSGDRDKVRAITLKHITQRSSISVHTPDSPIAQQFERGEHRRAGSDLKRTHTEIVMPTRSRQMSTPTWNSPRQKSSSPRNRRSVSPGRLLKSLKKKTPPPLPPKRHSMQVSPTGSISVVSIDKHQRRNSNSSSRSRTKRGAINPTIASIRENFPPGSDASSPTEPALPIISEPPPAELPPPHYLAFPGAPKPKKKHNRTASDGIATASPRRPPQSRTFSVSEGTNNRRKMAAAIRQEPMLTEKQVGLFQEQMEDFKNQSDEAERQGDSTRSDIYEKKAEFLQAKLHSYEMRLQQGEVPFDHESVQGGLDQLNHVLDDLLKKQQHQESLKVWDLIEKLKNSKKRFDEADSTETQKEVNEDVKLYLSLIPSTSDSDSGTREIKRLNDVLEWANTNAKPDISISTWSWLKKLEKCQEELKNANSDAEKQRITIKMSQLVVESNKRIKKVG